MATSVAYPHGHAIQRSFDLLCDYLNLGGEGTETGTNGMVRRVLRSPFVRPFFEEYTRDYLEATATAAAAAAAPLSPTSSLDGYEYEVEYEVEDIDYYALRATVQKQHAFRSKRFAGHGPLATKAGWSATDHAARFVVQTLRYSWRHGGPWDHGRWDLDSDESDLEFWQVW
ncbi:hypothetical protein PFICI_05296 [Pestalotiopsis fici W106-1]|uniref:Uncharacterized protein n=1 Tax=Pestalotiopsis fici (strain W106-1 / CGMCC3.15140) TaxID=1229662 RepID=W3XBK3_PESFW|nr:uncharacterized protein PFICI_05296 [Pestalotiopsis fici W106-1]ETS83420.1 hypothetical protein PFICI_05296 [Pestalotiopsis fici W106-1]